MADEEYGHPRLAAVYDSLYPDRSDLDTYLGVAEDFHARRVLDIGCGTGSFALLLAERGIEVIGLDPARASVDVAKGKPGSDRVQWICGDVTALPPLQVDLVTMTANVAPAIDDPQEWQKTLRGAYDALRPGGHLVFETRNPAKRIWETWNREASHRVTEIPGVGPVETWIDLMDVSGPLVTVRWTYVFPPGDGPGDGPSNGPGDEPSNDPSNDPSNAPSNDPRDDVLTSTSTMRFAEREEVEAELAAQGYVVEEIRDAPDRPGREFVFLARRPA
ncbi:class I SAM-dependent methyltransferase [Streptomyces sp. NPDC047117]|uniref:class I SAM-dependent methyltransferase n=1 Tax=Streptomyces sp. NPDC047117 TaxID=3155379 RepID=UPI0033E20335